MMRVTMVRAVVSGEGKRSERSRGGRQGGDAGRLSGGGGTGVDVPRHRFVVEPRIELPDDSSDSLQERTGCTMRAAVGDGLKGSTRGVAHTPLEVEDQRIVRKAEGRGESSVGGGELLRKDFVKCTSGSHNDVEGNGAGVKAARGKENVCRPGVGGESRCQGPIRKGVAQVGGFEGYARWAPFVAGDGVDGVANRVVAEGG